MRRSTAAEARFGAGSAEASAVADAWRQVGVQPRPSPTEQPGGEARESPADESPADEDGGEGGAPSRDSLIVLVERSGGFAGLRASRGVDVRALPPADADAWHRLLGSPLLHELHAGPAQPDRYVYRVACRPVGLDVTAPEQQLPGHVRELFERTLRGS